MKDFILAIIREGNKKVFSTWLGLLFLFGLVVSGWLIHRLSSELADAKEQIPVSKTFDPDSSYVLKFLPKEHRKGDGHWFGPVSSLTCTFQKHGNEWVVLEDKTEKE